MRKQGKATLKCLHLFVREKELDQSRLDNIIKEKKMTPRSCTIKRCGCGKIINYMYTKCYDCMQINKGEAIVTDKNPSGLCGDCGTKVNKEFHRCFHCNKKRKELDQEMREEEII